MLSRRLIIIVFFLFAFNLYSNVPYKNTDLIVFSFNRPLQLFATLETVNKYFSNLNQIFVLYRAGNQEYDVAYEEIRKSFPNIKFVKQGGNPRSDFKPLLLQCFLGSASEYIVFGVDDDIVKDYVDFSECSECLQKFGAYCFYLRLGTNTYLGYQNPIPVKLPNFEEVKNNILRFKFNEASSDWAYPNNLDMTIFKKSSIEHFFRTANYSSPNTLESGFCGVTNLNNFGLCYKTSKMFTLPLNIVQQDWYVPNENSFSVEELFSKWKTGFIMDIQQFHQINNNCSFMGYTPFFVKRK